MQTHPYLCEYECNRECQYQCERSLYISKYANANVIMRMRTLNHTTYGNTNIIICECKHYYAYANVSCNYERYNAPPKWTQMQAHPICECERYNAPAIYPNKLIVTPNMRMRTHPLFISHICQKRWLFWEIVSFWPKCQVVLINSKSKSVSKISEKKRPSKSVFFTLKVRLHRDQHLLQRQKDNHL